MAMDVEAEIRDLKYRKVDARFDRLDSKIDTLDRKIDAKVDGLRRDSPGIVADTTREVLNGKRKK